MVEIVRHNTNRTIFGEAPSHPFQHGRREINADSFRVRIAPLDQSEETAVASSKVKKTGDLGRQSFQKRRFCFGAVRDRIGDT